MFILEKTDGAATAKPVYNGMRFTMTSTGAPSPFLPEA